MKINEFRSAVLIEKGWSGDRKYCVTDDKGIKYLLRITDESTFDQKRTEFEYMQKTAALGVSMCMPVEFGRCSEGVYVLHSWIDGQDLRDVIDSMTDSEAYEHGFYAGEMLEKIHSIPAPEWVEDWQSRFDRKIDRKLKLYSECELKYDNGGAFIEFIGDNRHLLKGRPQSFQHGDYHVGNFMLENSRLKVIDFNRFDFGDPWEEFNRIVWSVQAQPYFASGMVDGYFKKEIPQEFWRLLALYISSNTLSSLPWAVPFGDKEINTMLEQAAEVLSWYDNMTRIVPEWYKDGAI